MFIISALLERRPVRRGVTWALAFMTTLMLGLTVWALQQSTGSHGPDPKTIMRLLVVDLVLILLLGGIVALRLSRVWIATRTGMAGSRLQIRLLTTLGLMGVIPAIIISIFSLLFFTQGVHSWFDDRVSNALEASLQVAESYLDEHKDTIRADALAMANDLNRAGPAMARANPQGFRQQVLTQAAVRALTEAVVFRRDDVLVQTDLSFSMLYEMDLLPEDMMARADRGEVVILTNDADTRVRALIKLTNFFDTYLLVGRFVDSTVLNHMQDTRDSVFEYRKLKQHIGQLQVQFSLVFIGIAMLIMLTGIWLGLSFSADMVRPISDLLAATERVKSGDFSTRVDEGPANDEIGTLKRAFNRMTGQLQRQRSELVAVNQQIEERRRMIEAVFSGVSAGVLALDVHGQMRLYNESAMQLLGDEAADWRGSSVRQIFPEVQPLLESAMRNKLTLLQEECVVARGYRSLTLLVRVVVEWENEKVQGFIVTFDDITELVTAQRSAAWADVARRIAHEIKNPLTPITLSAERIKRKYMKPLPAEEQESFARYLDTIIRHTNGIREMVDEFVRFARMPQAKLAQKDIVPIIQAVIFSEETVNTAIDYQMKLPKQCMLPLDEDLLTQLFTNLLKNAAESLLESDDKRDKNIHVVLTEAEGAAVVTITDNGQGFPPDYLERALEPYVTTKEKGTGLGLAICKRIMDEHNGNMVVSNRLDGKDPAAITGAMIALTFPLV